MPAERVGNGRDYRGPCGTFQFIRGAGYSGTGLLDEGVIWIVPGFTRTR